MTELHEVYSAIDQAISELVSEFKSSPHDFFSERDLHSRFAELARRRFGRTKTKDGHKISILRQEYNTVGRYSRSDDPPFGIRHSYQDRLTKAGLFDFAILDPAFVHSNDLMTVINKRDDPNRRVLFESGTIPFHAVIEFKMGHRARSYELSRAEVLAIIDGIKEDGRKCAHERPKNAFLLGFFHNWPLNASETALQKSLVEIEFRNINTSSAMHLYLIGPDGIV